MPPTPRRGSSKDKPSKKPANRKPVVPVAPKATTPAATRKPAPPGKAAGGKSAATKPPSSKPGKKGTGKAPARAPVPSPTPKSPAPKEATTRARAAVQAVVRRTDEPKGAATPTKAPSGKAAPLAESGPAPKKSPRSPREKAKVEMTESEPERATPPPPGSPAATPPARAGGKSSPPASGAGARGSPTPPPAAPPAAPPERGGAPAKPPPENRGGLPPPPVAPPSPRPPQSAPAAAPPSPPQQPPLERPPPPRPSTSYPPVGIPTGGTDDEEGWIPIEEDEGEVLGTGGEGQEDGGDVRPGGRRDIPPIPDEADEFEPIDEEDDELPASTPPAGASPYDVLEGVRSRRLHVSTLNVVSDDALAALASEAGLEPRAGERRSDLLMRLLDHRPPAEEPKTFETEGLLEILPDGYGFLRRAEQAYAATPEDAYVPGGILRKLGLLTGHWITAVARAPRTNERYPCVVSVSEVNHEEPAALARIVPFDKLTVTHPDRRLLLETTPEEVSMRLMDLFCPLGRGQRGLIVSPPRAGKTILMTKLADSIARNSPEVEIVVLLLDERPEEVTNMRRSVRGEVIGSTFDQPAHRHIRLAELVMEKVKRMVEFGRHVVLLLDSLTRLGRAYNNESGGTGRLLTGGLEASALTKPKRFFGAARNIEHGGSLTIVATALVDTGSRLDQVIFEEFKGSGNMEVVLSRELANQRLWPAIDIPRSGTRKEELLLHPEEQRRITAIRRAMSGQEAPEALTDILSRMKKHKTNAEFLMNIDLGSLSAGRDVE